MGRDATNAEIATWCLGVVGAPEIISAGETWSYQWPDTGFDLTFERIREDRDSVFAEVVVRTIDPVRSNGTRGHVARHKLNLLSVTSRVNLGKQLFSRNNEVDWISMLEIGCTHTLEQFREGEPILNIAEQEPAGKPEWLVERLMPLNETTVVFADGGSGKSFFALALALATKAGVTLPMGLRPTRQCEVLYLDWETNPQELRRRAEWLCRGMNLDPLPTLYYRAGIKRLTDDAAKLRAEVGSRNIGLVIIDSIGPAMGTDPESANEAIRAMNVLRTFDRTTRLVLAHVSKATAEQTQGGGKPFGSIFFSNLGRSAWEMRSNGADPPGIGLYQRKTNYRPDTRPIGLELIINDEQEEAFFAPYDIAGQPELAGHAPAGFRIRTALQSGGKTVGQLITELGLPANQIRARISQMTDVIRIDGGGRNKEAVFGLLRHNELPF